jgi:hypothetical protein
MNKEKIKEINSHISDALKQWAYIMVTADADEWAYMLDYSEKDALNALTIFNHVLANIGIKNGTLNEDNAVNRAQNLCNLVKDLIGIDSIELTNRVLKNE